MLKCLIKEQLFNTLSATLLSYSIFKHVEVLITSYSHKINKALSLVASVMFVANY